MIRFVLKSLFTRPRLVPVGTAAPDFVATDHLGREVTLAGLRGKKVVLWFYPKALTPG